MSSRVEPADGPAAPGARAWRRRWPLALGFLLVVGMGAGWLWRARELAALATDPRSYAEARARAAAAALAGRLAGRAAPALALARRVAGDAGVAAALAGADDRAAHARLLTALRALNAGTAAPEVAVEVLTPGWITLARVGPVPDTFVRPSGAGIQPVETLLQGSVYAHYAVALPITPSPGPPIGRVVAYVPLDTVHTLHARFRRFASPVTEVSEETGVPVFVLWGAAWPPREETDVRAEVQGPLGTVLAAAEASLPPVASLRREAKLRADRVVVLCAGLLVLGLLGAAARRLLRAASPPVPWPRVLALLSLLAAARGLLLALGFPSRLWPSPLWEPIYYANGILFGIAGSPGEALVTALFGVVAALAVGLRAGVPAAPAPAPASAAAAAAGGTGARPRGWAFRLALALGGGVLLTGVVWTHRAFLRSFVVDSTLQYLDLARVLPAGVELAMHAVAFITTLVALAGWYRAYGWLGARLPESGWTRLGGVGLAAATAAAGVLGIAAVERVPAASDPATWLPAGQVLLFALTAPVACRLRPLHLLIAAPLLAALAAWPAFEVSLHREARRDLEMEAHRSVRGGTSIVNDVVERVATAAASDPEVSGALSGSNPNDSGSLALRLWAAGLLAARGYDCALAVTTPSGAALSEFSLHMPPREDWGGADVGGPGAERFWQRRLTAGANGVEVSAGIVPVRDGAGAVIGQVIAGIGLPLGQGQSGPLPEIEELISEGRRRLPRAYRSEFRGEVLEWSTNPTMPRGYRVPAAGRAEAVEGGMAWVGETVGGEEYDSLYATVPGEKRPAGYIAFHLARPTAFARLLQFLYLFNLYVMFAVLLGLAGVVAWGIGWEAGPGAGPGGPWWRRGWASFEVRLVGLFFAVSLVPILLLAILTRGLISDRMEVGSMRGVERTLLLAEKLLLQAEAADALVGLPGPGAGGRARAPDGVAGAEWCRRIALLLGRDLSLYRDGRLFASSRPELYETELFSSFLDADVLLEAESLQRPLFFRRVPVGPWRYLVGYRPYRWHVAGAQGMLMTPLLENRREMDEEIGRTTTMTFGLYGLVLLLVWWGGQFLAQRISRPISVLVQGTRRVAAGNLDVQVELPEGGEFAELGEAFNRMTRELAEGRERLARAERESAWREMAKQIAHEIKNPLTPMKLNAQLLRQAYADGAENFGQILQEAVDTIIREVDLLSRIATEFSRFAKLPERRMAPCDVNDLLRECAGLFEASVAGRVEIGLELDEAAPSIVLDRDEMKRVFTNLVKNGLQAMPGGGRLVMRSLATPREGAAAPTDEVGTQVRRRRGVEVRVVDTGAGIPEELKGRLFEPYFSTKAEGTGLGLALCKKAVDDLGGSIRIESAAGQGTTVRVWLPA